MLIYSFWCVRNGVFRSFINCSSDYSDSYTSSFLIFRNFPFVHDYLQLKRQFFFFLIQFMNLNNVLKSFLNVTVTIQNNIKQCALYCDHPFGCIETKIGLALPIDYEPLIRKPISLSNSVLDEAVIQRVLVKYMLFLKIS